MGITFRKTVVLAVVLATTVAMSASSSSALAAKSSTATAASGCNLKQAEKVAAKAEAPLPVYGPPTSWNIKKDKGKAMWIISGVTDEFTTDVGDGFSAAAKAAGMTAKYVSANGSITGEGSLVQEAVTDHVGGIVLLNIDPHSVSKPLAAAKAAGIKTIDFNTGSDSDPLEPGVFAHVDDDEGSNGVDTAEWMLAQTKCNLKLATFNTSDLPIINDLVQAVVKAVHKLCKSCSVVQANTDISTYATTMGPLAVNTVHAHSNINMIYSVDAFDAVISPALQAAGVKIPLVGHDGSSSNLLQMKDKSSLQVMTDANPPEQWIGWALVDELGRGMAGVKRVTWVIPARIVAEADIAKGTDASIFKDYAHYETVFKKAWGLG